MFIFLARSRIKTEYLDVTFPTRKHLLHLGECDTDE